MTPEDKPKKRPKTQAERDEELRRFCVEPEFPVYGVRVDPQEMGNYWTPKKNNESD